MSGSWYFPEIQGSGAALFDYDNDGDLDVFLVQGAMLGDKALADATFAPGSTPRDRLFRNDLDPTAPGSPLRFTDVTEASGLGDDGYGMGVAAGDVDNDGDIDLYVTRLGPNRLWLNNGDGSFREAGASSGTADARWSHSAAFADLDRDGWLDLYVVNYVDYRLASHKRCAQPSGATEYCGPNSYPPQADRLYRNLGNGRFIDESAPSGIARQPAAGLGVVTADLDDNGWIDVYVANDDMPNQFWRNQGGRLQEDALLAGVAVNSTGEAEASMGVDAGDVDGDGDLDLFMTHLREETNTLYVNEGDGQFFERTVSLGLAAPSIGFTGFGTLFLDFDNDGDLDLVAINGEVREIASRRAAGDVYPLDQRDQLFRNDGGHFVEVRPAGPAFDEEHVGRGLAMGDVDNDGDTDLLVSNNSGPARLLINTLGQDNPWLGLRLLSREGRDALGARVDLELTDGRRLRRRVRTDGSYLSASDPRLRFGLGDGAGPKALYVRWADGSTERFPAPVLRVYTTLRQGSGS
ncbi:MAG: CRTAC1 family protein [Gammaproteobacteria bacterium]|nr:CRTAC1 family protein [Gammaproteobacteria bacterium]